MAGDMKNSAVHSESTLGPSKRHRVRRVCARWWWLFFLLLAAIILIIILPIVYVAYPHQARNAIKDASLNVMSMAISDPAPDSVKLSFDQVFYSDSKYHPTLCPFNASFYLLDNEDNPPFASIQTSRIKASNGSSSTIEPQAVKITQPEEFTRYVLLALESEEFTIALRGHGDLKQGILPRTDVQYDKNITMKGFNKLSEFALLSFHVLNGTESDGTNAMGTASIPNPTVMTIDLGTVTLGMSINGTDIGTATIEHLVLAPGDNIVQMRAEVYQLVVVGIVLARQDPILPVDIVGNTSTYGGQLIPYYTEMLAATALKVDLNVTAAVEGSNVTESTKRSLLW